MNIETKTDTSVPAMLSVEEKLEHGWDIVSFSERMANRLSKIRLLSAENDDSSIRTSGKEYIRQ